MSAAAPLLAGKRCLVTGGSRGLGRAIALAFARHGARVAFTYATDDADAAEAARLLTMAGAPPLVLKGSVADAAHVKDALAALHRAWGGIDVLVNNAGITQVLPISLLEEEDWDLVMDVNVKGAYLMSRAALRHMIREKRGVILNIGNFASERVIEAPVHYAASKSALRGLTEALAREVGRHGVRVNLLGPGLLEEGMAQGLPQHRQDEYVAHTGLRRLGRLDELAELAVFLCSDESAFMSAAKLVADGGL
ncbi:SDR family NAD(P)-dependent oxidoreductase [Sorangium sp. So ce1335]|uniref:SDR family NAD(P)-dependent oxidoreductase n=1 Tax=Sorangium sp. So ce1335 TaxID=3133335 RepID=UPI003F5D7547